MSDEEALLAAIVDPANPGEDTPRLAYADWLEENGQGERAEFIRAQCILASGYTNAKVARRERALLLNEAPHWVPGWEVITSDRWTYRSGMAVRFRRGFVSSVTCTAADWLQHGPQIVARHPVTEVRLSDARPYYHPHQTMFDPLPPPAEWDADWFRGTEPGAWNLPDELFEHLPRTHFPYAEFNDATTVDDAAHAALSAACLAWARHEVQKRSAAIVLT